MRAACSLCAMHAMPAMMLGACRARMPCDATAFATATVVAEIHAVKTASCGCLESRCSNHCTVHDECRYCY